MSMKKLAAVIAAAIAAIIVSCFTPVSAQTSGKLINGTPLPFFVYHGFRAAGNHYIPSGWMGDYGDLRLDAEGLDPRAKRRFRMFAQAGQAVDRMNRMHAAAPVGVPRTDFDPAGAATRRS